MSPSNFLCMMPECKILIADDEKLAREAIKLSLMQVEGIRIVAECSNGKETLAAITEHKPDMLFLDVQMPYLTGFDVLHKLDDRYSPVVIFVTAYDNYALQAFEHDTVDYLVKPFTDARFQQAFRKAYKRWHLLSNQLDPARLSLEALQQQIRRLSLEKDKPTISVRSGSKVYILPLEEVSHIEAAGNYTVFFTQGKKHLHKETLQALEERLPLSFSRIHKSVIVNTAFISELHSLLNGDFLVTLKSGHEVKLSRNYRERIAHLF